MTRFTTEIVRAKNRRWNPELKEYTDDGEIIYTVEVYIDAPTIVLEAAQRASSNKSGKGILLGGAVKAKVIKKMAA